MASAISTLFEIVSEFASQEATHLPVSNPEVLKNVTKALGLSGTTVDRIAEGLLEGKNPGTVIAAFALGALAVELVPELAFAAISERFISAALPMFGATFTSAELTSIVTAGFKVLSTTGVSLVAELGLEPLVQLAADLKAQVTSVDDLFTVPGPNANVTYGTSGDNTFSGTSSNEVFFGLDGNDTFVASAGVDGIYGGTGSNVLDYSAFTQGITFDAIHNKVVKSSGSDFVSDIEFVNLTQGSDTVIATMNGTAYADGTLGGSAPDTVDYSHYSQALDINLDTGAVAWRTGTSTTPDAVLSFENAIGTRYNDLITGNSADNVLGGGKGNDGLVGGAGNDTYVWNMGDGEDTITDSSGSADKILFGLGITEEMLVEGTGTLGVYAVSDQYSGGLALSNVELVDGLSFQHVTYTSQLPAVTDYFLSGTDVYGTPGLDTTNWSDGSLDSAYYGSGNGSGDDTITGTSANEWVKGYAGADTLHGGAGNDRVDGGGGADTSYGDAGNDILRGDASDILLSGGADNDWLQNGKVMHGDAGNDYITAYTFSGTTYDPLTYSVTIDGGDDNDKILARVSDSDIYGGNGKDSITVFGNDNNIYGSNISSSNTASDVIFAYGHGNTVYGGAGNDVISIGADLSDLSLGSTVNAGAGNNVIHLANNVNTLITGLGNDTVYKAADGHVGIEIADGVIITSYARDNDTDLLMHFSGGGTTRLVDYYGHEDHFTSIPEVPNLTTTVITTGSDVDEQIFGFSFQDVINAGAGDDTIDAGDGDDFVDAGDGDDTIYSLSGNDTLQGGLGSDIVWAWDGTMGLGTGDVTYQRRDDDLVLTITGGRQITLQDQYVLDGSVYTHAVEYLGNSSGNVDLLALMGGVNTAPNAEIDLFTGTEDTVVTGNVLTDNGDGADSDADTDAITVTAGTFATEQGGSVTIASNGAFTYTPAANVNGTDNFDYTITDGNGGSDTTTVFLNLAAVNDAPVAKADAFTGNEDTAITGNLFANNGSGADTDADGDTLSTTAQTLTTTHGSVAILANGNITYTPTANYNGSDSFSYTVSDGHGGSNTATVSLTITAVNDAPVAHADAFTGNEDTAITGNLFANNGSGADSDVEGDTLSTTAQTLTTTHGSVAILSNGNITYTPTANYNGSDSFNYTVSDGHGGSNTATVSLTVTAVNDAPTLTNNGGAVNQDTTLTLTTAMLTAADVDNTASQLGFTLQSVPAHGTLKLNGTSLSTSGSFTKQDIVDGHVTYVPTSNYSGSDTFNFILSDGTVSLSQTSFSLTVNATSQTIHGTSGADTINGGGAGDFLYGEAGDDTVYGNGGDDLIHGNAGSDWIEGGDGNDIIYTEGGAADYVFGGAGNDTIYNYGSVASEAALISGGYDLSTSYYDGLFGGDGNDTIYAQYNNANLYGDAGDDLLFGSSRDNNYVVTGSNNGNDTVDDEGTMNYVASGAGSGGADTIFLATASGYTYSGLKYTTLNNHQDLYIWLSSTAGITIKEQFTDVNNAIEYVYQQSTGVNSALSATLSSYDNNGGAGADTLYGFDNTSFGDDTIRGNGGDDTIYGYGGSDIIHGNAGSDWIEGGNGDDIIYAEGGTADYVFGGAGNDTIYNYGSVTSEAALISGGYDLSTSYYDGLFGGDGNDTIYAQYNNANLYGDAGDDNLFGSSRDNSYVVTGSNNGNDIVDDEGTMNYVASGAGSGGADTIFLATASGYTYSGLKFTTLHNHSDLYIWLSATDSITINEQFTDANNTVENIYEQATAVNHVISSLSTFDLPGATSGNDTLNGFNNNGWGDDTIRGLGGNDVINGKGGADWLYGGTGADTFLYELASAFNGQDIIKDFSKTDNDTINIADLLGARNPIQDAITDFVSLTTSGGNTILKVDTDGTGSGQTMRNVVQIDGPASWTSVSDMISHGNLTVV